MGALLLTSNAVRDLSGLRQRSRQEGATSGRSFAVAQDGKRGAGQPSWRLAERGSMICVLGGGRGGKMGQALAN